MMLEVTHAVLEAPISINPQLLFGMYFSTQQKATILLSTGTTTVPVRESISEIQMQLKRLQEQGKTDPRVLSPTQAGEA